MRQERTEKHRNGVRRQGRETGRRRVGASEAPEAVCTAMTRTTNPVNADKRNGMLNYNHSQHGQSLVYCKSKQAGYPSCTQARAGGCARTCGVVIMSTRRAPSASDPSPPRAPELRRGEWRPEMLASHPKPAEDKEIQQLRGVFAAFDAGATGLLSPA